MSLLSNLGFKKTNNMMRTLCFLFLATLFLTACAQSSSVVEDREAIRAVLNTQQQAWSDGDLEGFMQGYWKSDSLKFYGSSGLTYGWKQTLANYKKSYPTKAHTGSLQFEIKDLTQIEKDAYYVMGTYHLTREVGDAQGVFMILFRRIDGAWKIVADMSC